jgi:DNA-cytosine methyltransferase
MTLTVGSLFSGIGGIDLGLERAGMTVKWHSEIDPYACRVLKKHWPDVPNLGNIKEINWKEVEKVDVICGGYPCQPFSTAGKRNGEEDPRHLWPWVREAISELRPQYAILENVRGHLSLGGLSVIGELASIGYDAEWRVVSAASVGANHKRDRIVIVAYPSELFSNGGDNNSRVGMESETIPKLGDSGRSTDVAYANSLTRPMEGNVRLYRAKVEAGEMTEQEAEAILGKSVWEAQGKLPAMWPLRLQPTGRWLEERERSTRFRPCIRTGKYRTKNARVCRLAMVGS